MPVPIMGIPDKGREDNNNSNSGVDYSFLADHITAKPKNKKIVTASNKDASLLFEIWSKSKKTKDGKIKVKACNIDNSEILRLKSMGLVAGNAESIKITNRGKRVITVMALGEVNRFEKSRQNKPYNEILASLDKRGKDGYRAPKYATSSSNNIKIAQMDANRSRTLNDIFTVVSDKVSGVELFKDNNNAINTYIVLDFEGVEGQVKLKAFYLDDNIIIERVYVEEGTRKNYAEISINYDYPQTTADQLSETISKFANEA